VLLLVFINLSNRENITVIDEDLAKKNKQRTYSKNLPLCSQKPTLQTSYNKQIAVSDPNGHIS
jgi:hypothetical protein